jgi:hypothetical protein
MRFLITLVEGFAGKPSHAPLTDLAVIVTTPAERT